MKHPTIVIGGFHHPLLRPYVEELLAALGAESVIRIVDTIHYTDSETLANVSVEVLDFARCIEADYPVASHSAPLDGELVERLAGCEQIVLRMMDRLPGDVTYEERKARYLEHLRYWNGRITRGEICAFVSSNLPHEVFDYVLYELCRLHGIPTLFFHQGNTIPNVAFALREIEGFVPGLKSRYEQLRREEPRLSKEMQAYYESYTQSDQAPEPFYMKKSTGLGPFLRKLRRYVGQPDAFRRLRGRVRKAPAKRHKLRELTKCYNELAEPTALADPYVYVPLHYQPELTTSPLAGPYVDQELIVEALSAALPEEYSVLVKEHPKQGVRHRSVAFYRRLAAFPRVKLVPRGFSSDELVSSAVAVATATGTAGWEALLKGVPAILFGEFFYQHAPGAYRVHNLEELRDATELIVGGQGEIPTQTEIKRFLQAIEEVAVHGIVDENYIQVSTVSLEESTHNLVERSLLMLPSGVGGKS